MTVGFLLLFYLLPRPHISAPHTNILTILILIGLFQGIGLIFHNTALSLGPVPSVIAVKRCSIIFAVIWGIIFLQEQQGKGRLTGAALMVVGIGILGFEEHT